MGRSHLQMMSNVRLDAARYAAARQQRQLGVQMSPLQQFQPPPPSQSSQDPVERMKAAAAQDKANGMFGGAKPQGGDGSGRGLLGMLVNNTVTQTALKPVEALDYGRRAAVLGVEQWAKLMPEPLEALMPLSLFVDEDKVNADKRSNMDKLKDPTFGYGQISKDTGNKWLDRGIGLVGDIGLDPLTYLTFGAGSFAGAGGRQAAAAMLAAKGFSEEAVARVGRYGVNVANAAEREALGAGQAGLRMAGKRIGGTQTFAEVVGGQLSKGRAAIGDTGLATKYRAQRGDPVTKGAAEKLATGRNSEAFRGSAIEAASKIGQHNADRIGRGRFRAEFGHQVAKTFRAVPRAQRQVVTKEIEDGISSPLADEIRRLFKDVHTSAQREGIDIGDLGPNYVPHVTTEGFRKFLDSGDDLARQIRGIFIDDNTASGRVRTRQLVAGSEFTINNVTIRLERGTIEELNEKLSAVVPGVNKFYNDDIVDLGQIYTRNLEKDFGLKAGIDALLDSQADVARRIRPQEGPAGGQALDRVAPRHDVVNKKKTAKAQSKAVNKINASIAKTEKKIAKLKELAATRTTQARRVLSKEVSEGVGELSELSAAAKQAIGQALRVDARLGVRLDTTVKQLDTSLANIDRQLNEARMRLAVARDQAQVSELPELAEKVALLEADEALMKQFKEVFGDDPRIPGTAKADDAVKKVETKRADRVTKGQAEIDKIDQAKSVARQDAMDAVDLDGKIRGTIRELREVIGSVSATNPGVQKRLNATIDELEALSTQAKAAVNDIDVATTQQLLETAAKVMLDVERAGWTLAAQRSMLADAKAGKLAPIVDQMLSDGWRQIGKDLLKESDSVAVTKALAQAGQRVSEEVRSGGLWRVMDEYTGFFKAYATATPGFHMRNLMSATFMNFTDGVGAVRMTQSMKAWKQFHKDPKKFLENADPKTRAAFEATFGSGAGGRFSPEGLDEQLLTGVLKRVSDTRWTRASRHAGEWVEGPVRLAVAMDTIAKGGSREAAQARITRLHFDYSEVSNLDRNMKRLIPFWTFMSRNLPLQLQQMWMRPKAYAAYNSLTRNMGQDDNDGHGVPLWWRERGAFKVGSGAGPGGGDLYAMPDLQHLGLEQELEQFTNPQRFLSSASPLLRVPFETQIAKRNMFRDQEFRDGEDGLAYWIENMIPFVPQGQRLFADQSDYAKERRPQSIANWLGVPLRELTKAQYEAELKRLAQETK